MSSAAVDPLGVERGQRKDGRDEALCWKGKYSLADNVELGPYNETCSDIWVVASVGW